MMQLMSFFFNPGDGVMIYKTKKTNQGSIPTLCDRTLTIQKPRKGTPALVTQTYLVKYEYVCIHLTGSTCFPAVSIPYILLTR